MVLDSLENSNSSVFNRIELITGKKIKFIKGMRDKTLVSKILRNFVPDIVIHFAGLKSVSDSVVRPLDYYDVNVGGLVNLLDCMSRTNIGKIIFSSSATIYGDTQSCPCLESQDRNPSTPYGRSKLHCEQILEDWVKIGSDNQVVCSDILTVGAHVTGLIGEDPATQTNNLFPMLIHVANKKYPSLKIFGNDYETRDGTGERDYIHVSDLATFHLRAISKISSLNDFQALNLGTGTGTTVRELISTFELVSKQKIPFEYVERRAGDVARSWADVSLATELLNYSCSRTLHDMCKDAWNWQLKDKKDSR